VVPLRNTGAAISPFNAFLILQGIETLPLRMDRINANSLAVARHLQQHPAVAWVNYAGLEGHPDHALAQRILRDGGASGLLTFGLPGGREAGARSSMRCSCSPGWSTSATPSRWRPIRPRPPTGSFRSRNCTAPASARTPCACAWASSISTTCSPTWTRRWRWRWGRVPRAPTQCLPEVRHEDAPE
jgi:O-acetylhomoserine sulfhydrylase